MWFDVMTIIFLFQSCFYRGFNAEGQTEAELKTFLKQWLQLSQELDGNTFGINNPDFIEIKLTMLVLT